MRNGQPSRRWGRRGAEGVENTRDRRGRRVACCAFPTPQTMQYLIGFAGVVFGFFTWAIAMNVSQSGLPYMGRADGLFAWLLFSPALLCFLPFACISMRKQWALSVWLMAIAPIAGAANFFIAISAGTADPESVKVVWVLLFFWAFPIACVALGALSKMRGARRRPRRLPDEPRY